MKTQIRKSDWKATRQLLPLILGKNIAAGELEAKELSKLELFEKGLGKELKKNDTIQQAITKIVKMSLAAEFGPSLVAAGGARPMVETITRAILCDPQLRKQALVIIDQFTDE